MIYLTNKNYTINFKFLLVSLYVLFQSSDNPWDKLHHTIPLPEGPASLFDEDSENDLESDTNEMSGTMNIRSRL